MILIFEFWFLFWEICWLIRWGFVLDIFLDFSFIDIVFKFFKLNGLFKEFSNFGVIFILEFIFLFIYLGRKVNIDFFEVFLVKNEW